MYLHESDCVRYYTFESFEDTAITHAIFTRRGGVSPEPWASLNLGGTVGDDPARVAQNRQRVFQIVGRNEGTLYDVWQVHSAVVVCAGTPRRPHEPHRRADAILTNSLNLTMIMRFADCVPILLYDPIQHIIGIVHSGWLGTIKRVVRAAVETMHDVYHSQPYNILAAIGPSIGPDHYNIGPDVELKVRDKFKTQADNLLPTMNGCVHFDLWNANRLLLEDCGVYHIELAGVCTACNLDDWYSHRGEKGLTGRFGVLVGLNG
jgi:YfiH family protein